MCDSDCLTACELQTLSQMNDWPIKYAERQESWICRGQREGILAPELGAHHEMWILCLLEAICMPLLPERTISAQLRANAALARVDLWVEQHAVENLSSLLFVGAYHVNDLAD